MSGSYKLSDIFYFMQGEYRYFRYYGLDIRTGKIAQMYESRVEAVRQKSPECIEEGACKICGCTTPDLFFCDKACEGNCYDKHR